MSRPASTIHQSLRGKIMPGWALAARGGVIDLILAAFGAVLADAEEAAEALAEEIDPRAAHHLLADYERCLGPDPCGRDRDALTVEQRRMLAYQRWTARGGQSIPYFIAVAAALGVSITIDEFVPSRAGVLRAGQRLRPEGSQFVWRVNVPDLINVVRFRTGASRAGHRLLSFEVSSIECIVRRMAPAHTIVVFSYGAS